MALDEQLRVSGFKRILVRLDEETRRKYCRRALSEDLQRVTSELDACVAAMTQVTQVEDATRQLETNQRAPVSKELLGQLETLQTQLETAVTNLFPKRLNVANAVKEDDSTDCEEAKTLVKQILEEKHELTIAKIKNLEKKMPMLVNVDKKTQKWWKKHVQKIVSHGLEVVALPIAKNTLSRIRFLRRIATKMAEKCPELQDWHRDVDMQLEKMKQMETEVPEAASTKSKKKKTVTVPDDGTSLVVNSISTSTQKKSSKGEKKSTNAEKSSSKDKSDSVEKTRSLLNRCAREVRTLREKFELGAYDVNLSRMVTVVDSLWSGFEHSEIVALSTALFTLVETVEKVVNVEKRRDRLVCLESVLGVVLGSPKLVLTTRRKNMVEEYANNCRQTLEQLNRQLTGAPAQDAESPPSPAATSPPADTTGRTNVERDSSGSWPKVHVRFG